MITVYGIANCDTVKKARAWLEGRGVEYQFHDFKKLGVSADQLQTWAQAVGWEKLINRQGTTWRKLDPIEQAGVLDRESALALMGRHTSLIKRPVVQWPDQISVGFQADAWEGLAGNT
jgi:Spx/MgsR family transcriptional regulator